MGGIGVNTDAVTDEETEEGNSSRAGHGCTASGKRPLKHQKRSPNPGRAQRGTDWQVLLHFPDFVEDQLNASLGI